MNLNNNMLTDSIDGLKRSPPLSLQSIYDMLYVKLYKDSFDKSDCMIDNKEKERQLKFKMFELFEDFVSFMIITKDLCRVAIKQNSLNVTPVWTILEQKNQKLHNFLDELVFSIMGSLSRIPPEKPPKKKIFLESEGSEPKPESTEDGQRLKPLKSEMLGKREIRAQIACEEAFAKQFLEKSKQIGKVPNPQESKESDNKSESYWGNDQVKSPDGIEVPKSIKSPPVELSSNSNLQLLVSRAESRDSVALSYGTSEVKEQMNLDQKIANRFGAFQRKLENAERFKKLRAKLNKNKDTDFVPGQDKREGRYIPRTADLPPRPPSQRLADKRRIEESNLARRVRESSPLEAKVVEKVEQGKPKSDKPAIPVKAKPVLTEDEKRELRNFKAREQRRLLKERQNQAVKNLLSSKRTRVRLRTGRDGRRKSSTRDRRSKRKDIRRTGKGKERSRVRVRVRSNKRPQRDERVNADGSKKIERRGRPRKEVQEARDRERIELLAKIKQDRAAAKLEAPRQGRTVTKLEESANSGRSKNGARDRERDRGGRERGTSVRTALTKNEIYLAASEQNEMSQAARMRENLELKDLGQFFVKSGTTGGGSEAISMETESLDGDNEVNRIVRLQENDYTLLGKDCSNFIRKTPEGMASFKFPHEGFDMVNFLLYDDNLWMWLYRLKDDEYRIMFMLMEDDISKPVKAESEETLRWGNVIQRGSKVYCLKEKGIFELDLKRVKEKLREGEPLNIDQDMRCILVDKEVSAFCFAMNDIFIVKNFKNVIEKLTLPAEDAPDSVYPLTQKHLKSANLLTDEFPNESYIHNLQIKSVENDIVAITANKFILCGPEPKALDQHFSNGLQDFILYRSNQKTFVIGLHRKQDITVLYVHNSGFYIISNILSLEDDRLPYKQILHVEADQFLVCGEGNYQKLFEIKY